MRTPTQIDRQSLYEQVWREPLSTLCKFFGVSSTTLRTHCKKLNVPTPPRGYWVKCDAGEAPPRTPLLSQNIPVSQCRVPVKRRTPIRSVLRDIRSQEKETRAKIAVDFKGGLLSALALRLEARLDDIKFQCDNTSGEATETAATRLPQSWRRLTSGLIEPGPSYLAVVTHPASWPRALAIADAFICGMRDRGFVVFVQTNRTVFQRGEFGMYFRLTEILEMHNRRGLNSFSASGRLRIAFKACDPRQTEHAFTFCDQPSKTLEGQLNLAATRLRYEAVASERRSQEERETQRVAQERAFFEEVERWTTLQQRRAFLETLESEAERRGFPDEVLAHLDAWLKWARAICDRDDPLESHLDQILHAGHERL